MSNIAWPDRPTCHDGDAFAVRFGPSKWREAGKRLHPENDHVPAFRTCSYCGCIHPEDLLNALQAGATMSGSDWKYGYPHKFYVEKIPNSQAGNLVTRVSGSGPLPLTDKDRARYESYVQPGGRVEFSEDDVGWRARVLEPDGPTTHGKFYTQHLAELADKAPEAFDTLVPLIEQHTGIKWERDEKGVKWTAPSYGYQR